VIVLDTDVLAIYHLFTHDQRYEATETFMKITGHQARGTTLYNLMELAGIVSAAGKAPAAKKILETYARAADMKILYPTLALQTPELFWVEYCAQVMAVMERGLRYGDARILWVAESNECSSLVTWNAGHYRNKTAVTIMTPEEYCKA
jgi:predicted nucleic acid-binding protein